MDKNQELLLSFIVQLLKQKEKEEFFLKNVHLYNTSHFLFSPKLTDRYMTIIANKDYFTNSKWLMEENHRDKQYIRHLSITENAKALFLRYRYNLVDGKAKYIRNIISISDIYSEIYINMVSFPYLIDSIKKLYNYIYNGEITREIISKTLDEIGKEEKKKIELKISQNMIRDYKKTVVDSLNGKVYKKI